MTDRDSTKETKRTFVEGKTGSVELLEKRKGFIEVGIPEDQQIQPQAMAQEKINALIKSLSNLGDMNFERMKHAFDAIDDGVVRDYEKGLGDLDTVNLESVDLNGLNSRRSEMSILALILKVSREGANKTKILYEANLSGRQIKNYLNFLVNSGCLREKKASKKTSTYFTTGKGNIFLAYWSKILTLLEGEFMEVRHPS